MKLLQNILVAMDFGDASVNALKYAVEVANAFHSKIYVLHVISDAQLSNDTEVMMRDFLNDKFKEVTASYDPNTQEMMEFIIDKGSVFERISNIAIQKDVNVIIAGSGDNSASKYPLGTTVEKLMRKNQLPLWVVRANDDFPVKKILCPVDFSDASDRALKNAILLANRFAASLEVVYVYTPVNIQSVRLGIDNEKENKALKKARKKELDAHLKRFTDAEVISSVHLLEGQPEEEILKWIAQENIDLLIMGTTGRTGLSRILMGSITEKVTREVPSAFITTKSTDLARKVFDSNLKEIESFIGHAKEARKEGNLEKAIEYYNLGLKQFPDNIPMLIGLKECYQALGNTSKAQFYQEYATEVVKRVWGKEYLKIMNME